MRMGPIFKYYLFCSLWRLAHIPGHICRTSFWRTRHTFYIKEKVVKSLILELNQARRKVWKSGGASSTVVGIICPPLVEIGLTDLSNIGGAEAPPAPPWRQPCELLWFDEKKSSKVQHTFSGNGGKTGRLPRTKCSPSPRCLSEIASSLQASRPVVWNTLK